MLKVLFAASEAAPFVKTGGLGEVIGSLPVALRRQGVDARIILPKYKAIPANLKERIRHIKHIYVKLGWRNQYCGIEESECKGVPVYFIDNEYYFGRDGIYGYSDDEVERFAFFCRSVLEVLPHIGFMPDVIHCHDWQTGAIPVLLEAHYRHNDFYKNIRTLFTIHNLR
ncbi:MAG: starch synthase [Clostridiales bacterium]|nr:starch synthase [Clostridiales bacterium]